jgi:uncharacterized protein YdaU (DUF1376 family)
MARRRIPPMPVESLLDNPLVLTLPCAGYGILVRLLHHFWMTDCAPLPTQTQELQSIARAHGPTWRNWSATILPLVASLSADMARRRELRDVKMTALSNATRARAAAARALRAMGADDGSATAAMPRLGAQSRQKRAESRLAALESIAADPTKRFID